MIRRACLAGVALALIGGCKVRDEVYETEPPVQIAPGTGGERPYIPREAAGVDLADGYDADVERPVDQDEDRPVRRGEDRLASHQDLQRAIEDADRRIARLRTERALTDEEEQDLDALERRVREIRQDLDDLDRDAADWEQESDQLRNRLRRVSRQLEKAEEDNEA